MNYLVFYEDEFLGECDTYQEMAQRFPGDKLIDSFIYDTRAEFWRQYHVPNRIPLEDVPNTCRTALLLMR